MTEEQKLAAVYLKGWREGHKVGRRTASPSEIHDMRKQLYMLEVSIQLMREFLDKVEASQA